MFHVTVFQYASGQGACNVTEDDIGDRNYMNSGVSRKCNRGVLVEAE